MNYARFLTAVSAARKPSPIRMLSKCSSPGIQMLTQGTSSKSYRKHLEVVLLMSINAKL